MLTIRCQCGEVFHAEERHIGRAIKCRGCGQVLSIGSTTPAPVGQGSMETPRPSMKLDRSAKHRWSIAAFSLVAIVTAGAVLLFSLERDQPRILPPPAEVMPRPAPQPLLPPTAPRSEPTPLFPLEAERAPLEVKPPVARLKTGTNIGAPLGASGHGTLQINNGTSYDAAVTLLDQETKIARRFVYIGAREMFTLRTIGPCQCQLFFAMGIDWDDSKEKFRKDPTFSVFDDRLHFTESNTESGVQWATFIVTLHPVPEGRAKTTRLSEEEYKRQVGKGTVAEAPNSWLNPAGEASTRPPTH